MKKILGLLLIGVLSLSIVGCSSTDQDNKLEEPPQEVVKMSDEEFNKEINSIWDYTLETRNTLLESTDNIDVDEIIEKLNDNNIKIIDLKESYADVPVLEEIYNNANYLVQALYEHKRENKEEYNDDINKFTDENVNIINTLMSSYK